MSTVFLTVLLAARLAFAVTVDEVLAQIDKNMTYEARDSSLTMTVTKGTRVKAYKMRSYGRGQDEMAMVYLEPARDKGTKMLKKGEELWMYLPAIEKVQKLSGHLLRDDLMGSDMSYEDLMESSTWRDAYVGTMAGEELIEGRKAWKIDMKARDTSVSYPRRVIWVDQASHIPVRQELYALQGMLLKTWLMQDIRSIEGRQFPMKMVVEDQVQKGSRTEIVFDAVSFKVALPEEVFSTRWLER